MDVAELVGTGRRGRVEARDVFTYSDKTKDAATGSLANVAAVPTVDFAKFGPVESVARSRIQRISGPRLHSAWVNIPHVTHFDDADVTDLEAFRKALDQEAKADKDAPYRVSLLPFLMKAAVVALKAFPAFNSVLSPAQDGLIRRLYWHIGVAVDTPEGLVVAVVRDVDRKGVTELARDLAALSGKAREGRLSPSELQGSTFTISSLGGIGGSGFTPIINAPEVAILGVARMRTWPAWDGSRVPAAADAAAVSFVRPPRDRRRRRGPVHAPSLRCHRGRSAHAAANAGRFSSEGGSVRRLRERSSR